MAKNLTPAQVRADFSRKACAILLGLPHVLAVTATREIDEEGEQVYGLYVFTTKTQAYKVILECSEALARLVSLTAQVPVIRVHCVRDIIFHGR